MNQLSLTLSLFAIFLLETGTKGPDVDAMAWSAHAQPTLQGNQLPDGCLNRSHEFEWPTPAEDNRAFEAHSRVLRARISIAAEINIEIYEQPKSGDRDYYDSQVVVSRVGGSTRSYDIGRMIRGGRTLRVLNTSEVCEDSKSGLEVLEFEGGANGLNDGFAIIRFSPKQVSFSTLPLTAQGKLILDRKNLDEVELWSANPNDLGLGTAEPKRYITRKCPWESKNYHCGTNTRDVGPVSPQDVDNPGIEIR